MTKNSESHGEISEKQRLANIENAKKSSGPKTPEGKERSSQNALKHGFRAQAVTLPHEDPMEYHQRLLEYFAGFEPTDMMESKLLETFVAAQWRMERCVKGDTAMLTKRVVECYDQFDLDTDDHLRTLTRQLHSNPRHVCRQLRMCAAGCKWAADRLETHLETLDIRGFLYPSERDQILNILGLTTEDLFSDSLAFDIVHAFIGGGWSTEINGDMCRLQAVIRTPAPEGMASWEYRHRIDSLAKMTKNADPVAARAKFEQILRPEIEHLRGRLAYTREKEARLRASSADRAALDTSAEGQLRLRYEMMLRRETRNAFKDLMEYRKSKGKWELSGSRKVAAAPDPAPNEPISEILQPSEPIEVIHETGARGMADAPIPSSQGPATHAKVSLGLPAGPNWALVAGPNPSPENIREFADEITGTMNDWDYDTMTPM